MIRHRPCRRRSLAHRAGLFARPLRSLPAIQRQYHTVCSAVAVNGGEIGRAQALQAQAAGIEPTTDMNPVLLKPNTDLGAQVIVHGRAIGNMAAIDAIYAKAGYVR